MTFDYYKMLIGEYINLGCSEEKILAEIGYPEEITLDADNLIKAVSIIAAVVEKSTKKLVKLSELSMRAFADKYLIPYRTVQDWCADVRKPPEYVPIMIGYIIITEMQKETDNGDI